MQFEKDPIIAVIGLGYVGLPLAVEFGKKFNTIGFDINQPRVEELLNGHDSTLEVDDAELATATKLNYCCQLEDLKTANVYIVTVPTPIDQHKRPDLTPLIKASEMLGKVVSKGDIIVYESTVYPGATEDDCIPVVARESGLKFNEDFFAGYSPERINPGDKQNRLPTIKKVTSGSTPEVADYVDSLYKSIIIAGTHKASSIRVAEASKVIENTQRDISIAIVNEFAQIFNALEIDTHEVLEAAGTKWNFLPFKPGLVGGHCIGVDPYYLSHKAKSEGYIPDILIAGRRINDGMGAYVARKVMDLMIKNKIHVKDSKVLVLGITFKENCPDIRNSKVIDVIHELERYEAKVDVVDPWANANEVMDEYGVTINDYKREMVGNYDTVILAVSHQQFTDSNGNDIKKMMKDNSVLYDVKSIFDKDSVDGRL